MPRVSVVIPAFNAERYLAEAIRSVAQQTFRDRETVVVDDGSTDRTAEIAAAHRGIVVLSGRRGGPAAARNAGIERASGAFVAFLDADDVWLPPKLERQLAGLEASRGAVLCATGVEPIGVRRGPAPVPLSGDVTERLVAANFVTTSSVLVPREALERSGRFDEDEALVGVEDYELWLRLSLRGPFAAVPERLVRRRRHDRNLTSDALDLDRRTSEVLRRFAETAEARAGLGAALRRRRGELAYRIGRALLARGRRSEARAALREARRLDARRWAGCRALEAASRLPSGVLLAVHRARERGRRARRDGR